MICKKCYEDIEEKGQDNVSPICGYPVCEDCKDEIWCENCCETGTLYYDEENGKLLCAHCLAKKAEKSGLIFSVKTFYTSEGTHLGTDEDFEPVAKYLSEVLDLEEVHIE